MRRLVPSFLAAALVMAPLGAQAADLVVWWEHGYSSQENEAVREIISAFEQKTGKQIELDQPSQDDIKAKTQAAIEAGQPPDFLFGTMTDFYYGKWASE
jgi:multiple sugar transport system substrate-binding protein